MDERHGVRRYAEDLRELLADGTLIERKSWPRTWTKRGDNATQTDKTRSNA